MDNHLKEKLTDKQKQVNDVVDQILGWQQLKNSLNMLGGEMSIHYISDTPGVVGTKIEIYIPEEKTDIS